VLLALEMSGFSSTSPRIIWVVVILVLFIVVTGFVERLVQSHDMQCDPCIAIICVTHSCFIMHTLVFSLAIHRRQEVVFLYHLAKLWQQFTVPPCLLFL
jgi:hypothetical protein